MLSVFVEQFHFWSNPVERNLPETFAYLTNMLF